MKNFVFLFLLVLSGCGSDKDSSSSLSEYVHFSYQFEGDGDEIVDSSAAGNHAKAKSVLRVEGKVGSAIKFQEIGSNVLPPKDAFPVSGALTFRAWVKTDTGFSERQQLIGGLEREDSECFIPINNYGIYLVENKIAFELASYPTGLSVRSKALPIVVDEWFHVAITYDSKIVKYFFDGVKVGEGSISRPFDSNFRNQIGQSFNKCSGVVSQFYGYLDELYLSSSAHSEEEILNYYSSTK